MDIFNDIEDSDKKINGIRPELLPNLAFINKKPEETKAIFIKKFIKFMEHHDISKTEFEKEFLMGRSVFNRWEDGSYSPYLRTAQRALEDCFLYDSMIHPKKKDRAFKRVMRNTVKKNFFTVFDLFKARHFVAESSVSEVFLGNPFLIAMFRTDKISLRLRTIDKINTMMYEEDCAMKEEMGESYVRFINN